jgi:hypothetical protein
VCVPGSGCGAGGGKRGKERKRQKGSGPTRWPEECGRSAHRQRGRVGVAGRWGRPKRGIEM